MTPVIITREDLPDAPQAVLILWPQEHQHGSASHDIHGETSPPISLQPAAFAAAAATAAGVARIAALINHALLLSSGPARCRQGVGAGPPSGLRDSEDSGALRRGEAVSGIVRRARGLAGHFAAPAAGLAGIAVL